LRIAVADRGSAGESKDARPSAIVDRDGTMPGRGAYLCRDGDPSPSTAADRACLERAMRRGGIARALRSSVTLDPKLVESVMSVAQPAEGRPVGPLTLSKNHE
jgi:predicted RNA-binding protein YlxR (DUF448 family)